MRTIEIYTKPYVAHFITMKYGDPAQFDQDKNVMQYLDSIISKPCRRHDKYYGNLKGLRYKSPVRILLNEKQYNKCGGRLTKTDSVKFSGFLEGNLKYQTMYIIWFYQHLLTFKDSTKLFQKNFNFPEEVWPYESIKKSYYKAIKNEHKLASVNIKDEINNMIINRYTERSKDFFINPSGGR